jgi:predicted nucleotidyltransferase
MQHNPYPLISKSLSVIKENILETLAYFDLFDYPLCRAEIYLFLKNKHDYDTFDQALKSLLQSGIIHQFDKFYTLKNDQYLVVRRNNGNKKAAELIKIAEKVGSLLIRFPYVRGIAISGSLSKNFADENSDVDLFIITAKNKLWIARTIMHCFKKLTFLVNKEHLFCMNYYVDEQQMEIAEKNLYTAIEIGTLIPLQGDTVFERFYTANAWTRDYLPNKNMRIASAKPVKGGFLKSLLEVLFNNSAGDIIDDMLMRITGNRWLKKTQQKKLNSHGIIMGMDTGKHYAKPDPKNFQSKLLAKYEHKVSQLLKEHETTLVQ